MTFHGTSRVLVAGSETQYASYGNPAGEPIILVHGFRGDYHGLEPIAKQLDCLHVLIPDLPGFGGSGPLPTPHTLEALSGWLRAFIEVVTEGKSYHLLGHSFGSLVVSHAVAHGITPATLTLINPISAPALKGPQRLLSLAALGYYRLGASLPQAAGEALLRNPLIVRGMSEVMAKTSNRSLRAWIHQQHHQYFSAFSDRDRLSEAFLASISHTVGEFAATLCVPTLIIAGDLDDITPLRKQVELSYTIPHSQIRIIAGTGHLIHYEAPTEAADYVSSFVAGKTA